MEIRIGVRDSAREITLETSLTEDAITKMVSDAVSGGNPVLMFRNEKGSSVLVPTLSLGYVEFIKSEERRVGFIA